MTAGVRHVPYVHPLGLSIRNARSGEHTSSGDAALLPILDWLRSTLARVDHFGRRQPRVAPSPEGPYLPSIVTGPVNCYFTSIRKGVWLLPIDDRYSIAY